MSEQLDRGENCSGERRSQASMPAGSRIGRATVEAACALSESALSRATLSPIEPAVSVVATGF
ncbi:hypothetical protein [Nocardia sp. NPDC050793]|uniref:hypothetical protein n=1 Tax=Nocardia sp. NPDC050793 TaxID=3155159 RepID=UPI0033DE42C5